MPQRFINAPGNTREALRHQGETTRPVSFGSKSEASFAGETPGLTSIHGLSLKHPKTKDDLWFTDSNGETYRAQGDFYATYRNQANGDFQRWVIEFKTDRLNRHKNIASAYAAEQTSTYRNPFVMIRETSWSNSAYKHLAVQQTLKGLGVDYLVVFSRFFQPSTQQKRFLDKIGLNYCLQQDMEFFTPGCTCIEDWLINIVESMPGDQERQGANQG